MIILSEKKLKKAIFELVLEASAKIAPSKLSELEVGACLVTGKFSELERGRVYTWAEKNKKKVSIKRLPNGNMVVTRVA